MDTVMITQIIFICTGVLFLWHDFYNYVKRRMVATIGIVWGFISLMIILFGAIPGLLAWIVFFEWTFLLAAYILVFSTMLGIFFLSISVSKLIMKNQELAMHVSLLNQENERILSELERLMKAIKQGDEKDGKDEKKDTVCN